MGAYAACLMGVVWVLPASLVFADGDILLSPQAAGGFVAVALCWVAVGGLGLSGHRAAPWVALSAVTLDLHTHDLQMELGFVQHWVLTGRTWLGCVWPVSVVPDAIFWLAPIVVALAFSSASPATEGGRAGWRWRLTWLACGLALFWLPDLLLGWPAVRAAEGVALATAGAVGWFGVARGRAWSLLAVAVFTPLLFVAEAELAQTAGVHACPRSVAALLLAGGLLFTAWGGPVLRALASGRTSGAGSRGPRPARRAGRS